MNEHSDYYGARSYEDFAQAHFVQATSLLNEGELPRAQVEAVLAIACAQLAQLQAILGPTESYGQWSYAQLLAKNKAASMPSGGPGDGAPV